MSPVPLSFRSTKEVLVTKTHILRRNYYIIVAKYVTEGEKEFPLPCLGRNWKRPAAREKERRIMRGRKVVVVSGEPGLLRVLQHNLSDRGCQVRSTKKGATGAESNELQVSLN